MEIKSSASETQNGGHSPFSARQQVYPSAKAFLHTWTVKNDPTTFRKFRLKSSSLPFGQSIAYASTKGPIYVTAQTLVQQVVYALSDNIFSSAPESFDLDISMKDWSASNVRNTNGIVPKITYIQTSSTTGATALGYIFSKDIEQEKKKTPQSFITFCSFLQNLRPFLGRLSPLYSVYTPFVAHVAAIDYETNESQNLVTDYMTALNIAKELGLGLVSSSIPSEAQHMALFSTALANVLPTIHIYDGLRMGRDTSRVTDVLNPSVLSDVYNKALAELNELSKKAGDSTKVNHLLQFINRELGTNYSLFDYRGHSAAENVLVVFGSVESSLAGQVAEKLSAVGNKVGVISVRVFSPFSEEAFTNTLPNSVKKIYVLGQVLNHTAVTDTSINSSLYEDILAAIVLSHRWARRPSVFDLKYDRGEKFTPTSIAAYFSPPAGKIEDAKILKLLDIEVEKYTFFDIESTPASTAPLAIGKLLSVNPLNHVFINQTYDISIQGGTIRTDIRCSKKPVETFYSIEVADVVYVGNEKLLEVVDVVKNIKFQGKLILKLPGIEDHLLDQRLPDFVRKEIMSKDLQVFLLDPSLSTTVQRDKAIETMIVELAFLEATRPDLADYSYEKLASINGNSRVFREVSTDLDKIIRPFVIPQYWSQLELIPEVNKLPWTITPSSFTGLAKGYIESPLLFSTRESLARGFVFKEAYSAKSTLAPDFSTNFYEITVQEKHYSTSSTHSQEFLHIEFALSNSGLTFGIGETLCIHAENSVTDTLNFIILYGLDADDIIDVPFYYDESFLEVRTVYQYLVRKIDIFGKPTKKFYSVLSRFASDEEEKFYLTALGSPEGENEYRRRAELENVTYADILLEFKSARPSFRDIIEIIPPIKCRKYSIASSQMVSPSSVSILIAVVSWIDSRGRNRYGQATRYLNELSIGSKVCVSVESSMMKLPAADTTPIIMAGLGTGVAPFRAFVQDRALKKLQGKAVGSVLIYLGSQRQSEEYLFGEEWEAYKDAGVITLLSRAFSHDQPQKIFIQDRMRETMSELIQAYVRDEGVFYLSGPTWLVLDVIEALKEAIEIESQEFRRELDPNVEIEILKEKSRLVLEVY